MIFYLIVAVNLEFYFCVLRFFVINLCDFKLFSLLSPFLTCIFTLLLYFAVHVCEGFFPEIPISLLIGGKVLAYQKDSLDALRKVM